MNLHTVSWKKWIDAGNVPAELNALLPLITEVTSITTKRLVRLTKMVCKHLPIVLSYISRVANLDLSKARASVDILRTWFTKDNESEWISMVRKTLNPIKALLKDAEKEILNAFTILSQHTVIIWDVLKTQKKDESFVDRVMMESMMQWSDACAITNRSEKEQQNYTRAMAVNFADTSITTADKVLQHNLTNDDLKVSLQWQTMNRSLIQLDTQWLAQNLKWLRQIAFTSYHVPVTWLESFYLLIIPLFANWYGTFFNSVSENIVGLVNGYRPGPIKGSIELLHQLKSLNISALSPSLSKERDLVVSLGNSLIERTDAAARKSATTVATLEDANIAATLMTQVLSGNLPDMKALNVLYKRRFGTNVKWLTILSSLTATVIESEVMRIYNAYVSLATVEIVGAKGKDGVDDDEGQEENTFDLEPLDFEEILERVIPENALNATEAWTEDERRQEQRDLQIILSGNKTAIIERINRLSGLVALAQEDIVAFTRFMTISSAEDLALLRNRIAPLREEMGEETVDKLEVLLGQVNRNMTVERMIAAKKKQMRFEWYATRLRRLREGLRGNEIKADFKVYLYAALITLAFYVMWCLISNLPTVGHYAHQSFRMTSDLLTPSIKFTPDPTKIVWAPDITWNLQSWKPLVDYVNFQMINFGVADPPEYIPFTENVTSTIIDNAFEVGSSIVSSFASTLYNVPGMPGAMTAAQFTTSTIQDFLTEVNEKDAGLLKFVEYLQNGGNLASFEFAQLVLLTIKVNAWVLPLMSVFNGAHIWLMSRRTPQTSSKWVVAHNFYHQNRFFAVAYLSSFVVIPALNKTVITAGRLLALSTVAGIGSIGATPLVLLLLSRRLAPNISDREKEEISRVQKLQRDIERNDIQVERALQTVSQIRSSTMVDLLQESRKLTLDKISDTSMAEQLAEVKTKFTDAYHLILKEAVPEESLKIVAPLLLSKEQQNLAIAEASQITDEEEEEEEEMKRQAALFALLRKKQKEEAELLENL